LQEVEKVLTLKSKRITGRDQKSRPNRQAPSPLGSNGLSVTCSRQVGFQAKDDGGWFEVFDLARA
jgi:hypothetical protein